jgi:quinol monooxygenase YgiN
MKTDTTNMVSLHPYFKAKPGKLGEVKALLPAFVAKTTPEPACLFYDFTLNGDELACREGYAGAEGALAHLDSVGALLGEMLKIADLIRLEIHGPAAELEKLKAPLSKLNPAWFVRQVGV